MHCSMPRQQERSLAGVGIGICIGVFLSICLTFESRSDTGQKFVAQAFHPSSTSNSTLTTKDVWIRCVVLVKPEDPRPHKYVRSILDTYAKRCNKTVFFTKEEKLLPKFHDEVSIYALNNFHAPTSYSFFHLITQLIFSHAQKSVPSRLVSEWTIFLNEQNFLVPENLRFLVQNYDSNEAIVFGRLTQSKWILTYLFPYLQTEMFQIEAGVLMSRAALEQIVLSDKCQPYWFIPAHTGKGLFACGKTLSMQLIDPVDKEGYHLFMNDNLKNLFSLSHFSASDKSFEDSEMKAHCCSDKLISVGLVSHRDLRVMEYLVNHIRVFGN